jgi:rhodanese-related sulfurtransferase
MTKVKYLSAGVAGLLFLTLQACGPDINPKTVDQTCRQKTDVALNQDTYLGSLVGLVGKGRMIMLQVNGENVVFKYDYHTTWNGKRARGKKEFGKVVGPIRKKKGHCTAIKYNKALHGQLYAHTIKVTEAKNEISKKTAGLVNAEKFYKMVKGGIPDKVQIIDVRQKGEIPANPGTMLLGAKNIPLSSFPAHIKKLDPSKEYYFNCRTGGRAKMAYNLAQKQGLKGHYVRAIVSTSGTDINLKWRKTYTITGEQITKITGKKPKVDMSAQKKKGKGSGLQIEGC